MKIAIAGLSGYLGNEIKNALAPEHSIIGIDLRNPDLSTVQDYDVMINCIGKTTDGGSVTYEDLYDSNVAAAEKIYQIFQESQAHLLIHLSSISAVSDFGIQGLLTEDTRALPESDYGKTKKIAEDFLLKQIPQTTKKIIILRPARIYGAHDKGTIRQLYNFVTKIPYPFAAYENSRSFLYLENFIYIIEKIVNSEHLESGIYNLADDEPISTVGIIEVIENVKGKKLPKLPIPTFIFSSVLGLEKILKLNYFSNAFKKITTTRIISTDKIKKMLNISSLPYSAREGLKKTIETF